MATHSCAEAWDANADLSVLDKPARDPSAPIPCWSLLYIVAFLLCVRSFMCLALGELSRAVKVPAHKHEGLSLNLQQQQEELSTAGCSCHHSPDPWGLLDSRPSQIGEFQAQQETVSKLRWKPGMVVYTFNCSRGRGLNRGGSEFKDQ